VVPPRQRETAAWAPGDGGSVRIQSEPPPERVRAAPEVEPPVAEGPTPVTPPRQRGTATRVPSGDSARAEPDAPDPSAIIDWLLRAKGRQPGEP
jgi:hypothetical protein